MEDPTADPGRDGGADDGTPWSRRLLTPRWVAFTLLVVVAVCAFLFMAWWQLHRFESSTGSWQNLGYTLQWPFFAAFAVYLWWRLLRDAGRPSSGDDAGRVEGSPSTSLAVADEPADSFLPPLAPKSSGPTGSTRDSLAVSEAAAAGRQERAHSAAAEPDDPELDAYNAYLNALHRRSEESA